MLLIRGFHFDSFTLFFWFDLVLGARAEILKIVSLVFRSKQWHQKNILKLSNLYYIPEIAISCMVFFYEFFDNFFHEYGI